MYSPEANWLLGTESEQRRESMKKAILGETETSSYRAARAAAPGSATQTGDRTAVFFDDDLSHFASVKPNADGHVVDVHVLNGLTRRGPREPAVAFSLMPARYM